MGNTRYGRGDDKEHKTVKIGITGHRPKYFLNPKKEEDHFIEALSSYISLLPQGEISFVLGGAQGVDSWAARYCMTKKIPYDLKVPFPLEVQSKGWPMVDKLFLLETHKRARSVETVAREYYSQAYQRRNELIVNKCDLLLSWLTKMKSGSGNCVKYAEEVNKKHVYLRKWYKSGGE